MKENLRTRRRMRFSTIGSLILLSSAKADVQLLESSNIFYYSQKESMDLLMATARKSKTSPNKSSYIHHWKATMEYYRTKDILHVMKAFRPETLGTPSLHTTADIEDDQYVRKAAINAREGTELIEAGYEYLCDVENVQAVQKRQIDSKIISSRGSRMHLSLFQGAADGI